MDDLEYLFEDPDPQRVVDYRELALHALSSLDALGIPVDRMVGVDEGVLAELAEYQRGETSYT